MIDPVGQILTIVFSVLLTAALVFGVVRLVVHLTKKKRDST